MPSVYDLKPRFQALLRPAMHRMARLGITPNVVTVLALAGSIICGGILVRANDFPALLLSLPGWLFARMALNAIDGMMARELNLQSILGGVLNELGDVLSDAALYLPLAFLNRHSQWAIVAFSLGAIITEFCGVLSKALGASRRYDGPMGKSDRAFVVGAVCLISFAVPRVIDYWAWFFWAATVLTALTCWNRVAGALAELNENNPV